jgi:hypothetical protein
MPSSSQNYFSKGSGKENTQSSFKDVSVHTGVEFGTQIDAYTNWTNVLAYI